MKVVIDTNVLLSGLMSPQGAPGRVVAAWREARFDLVLSMEQLGEIARVLTYPKIQRVLRWDDSRIEQFLKQLYVRAELADLRGVAVEALGDPADEPILAALVASQADVLVTGDAQLLKLRDRHPIQTPAQFAGRL